MKLHTLASDMQLTSMSTMNPILMTDSYKLSHILYTSPGVKTIYSNFTPRFTHYLKARFPNFDGKIVWFGLHAALVQVMVEAWQRNFFEKDKDTVIQEAKDILRPYIGMQDFSHFEKLHDLGYMPVEILALKEGSLITKGIPCFTITNTHEDFQWLPNYLESILTVQLWKIMTVATIGRLFKMNSEDFAMQTTGSIEGTEFQNHDFSLRGHSGYESAGGCGAAFLISSSGTDNVPALQFIRSYYGTDIALNPVAFSIPAGEHSVTTLGIQINARNHLDLPLEQRLITAEYDYLEEVLAKFPTGILAYVADSYDYFSFLTDILPLAKDTIMGREGKLVIRGDSGDPVEIICGSDIKDYSDAKDLDKAAYTAFSQNFYVKSHKDPQLSVKFYYKDSCYKTTYDIRFDKRGDLDGWSCAETIPYELTPEEKGTIQILYETFGGTVNDLGYKVLDEHIGMIYGDGITMERAIEVFTRLKYKGYASLNIVFGIGAYSIASMLSRDDLGIAVKATAATVTNGDSSITVPVYKEPKTDTSKKSAKGFLKVSYDKDTEMYSLEDNVTYNDSYEGEMKIVFIDGVFTEQPTFQEIKDRLYN